MTVLEAAKKLMGIHAEHGDIDLVVEVGREWPPDERQVLSIDVKWPCDAHDGYTDIKRAVIEAEGLG